ncbi:MAG: CoA-binding protein, partial [Caulobacterales bacterium]|nr:CoA-binding protein [Caulobacterales bacterium]
MASIGAPPASGAASLDRLMTPRSVALVGASERSIWSTSAHDNLARFGYAGKIHPINPKGGVIHGVPAATSCAAVGEPIDAALVMVPEAALLDTFADLEAAGVGGAVVLSAGFAETGEDGARRQRAAADAARAAGIRLVGPNCLGFANYVDQTVLWTTPLRRGLPDPQIAVVSQSGALAGQLEQFCYQQRAGLTHLVSTGNEADVTVADVIAHLATRPEPRAIAVFLEMVRDPGAFMQAIAAANAADKPVIVLKVGASEAAAA